MLAKRVGELPVGGDWIFEPKWDGFRALVFRDGDEILIQSRDQKSLNRYFPELVETLLTQLPARCVLDGEIVIAAQNGLDFELLQLRIHPAASRVKLLSQQTPTSIVFFDLLCVGDQDLRGEPFEKRRREMETLLASAARPVHVTPATSETRIASDWFRRFEGAGLDGVIAKPKAGVYEPDKRVMLKVKHERDCDCVVAGFRWHKAARAMSARYCWVFSMMQALYSTSECAPASRNKCVASLPNFLSLIAGMRWFIIHGAAGRNPTQLANACLGARAAGAKARICHGNRCGRSWW